MDSNWKSITLICAMLPTATTRGASPRTPRNKELRTISVSLCRSSVLIPPLFFFAQAFGEPPLRLARGAGARDRRAASGVRHPKCVAQKSERKVKKVVRDVVVDTEMNCGCQKSSGKRRSRRAVERARSAPPASGARIIFHCCSLACLIRWCARCEGCVRRLTCSGCSARSAAGRQPWQLQ